MNQCSLLLPFTLMEQNNSFKQREGTIKNLPVYVCFGVFLKTKAKTKKTHTQLICTRKHDVVFSHFYPLRCAVLLITEFTQRHLEEHCSSESVLNFVQGVAHPNEPSLAQSYEATSDWHPAQPHQISYHSTVMTLCSQGASINKCTVT